LRRDKEALTARLIQANRELQLRLKELNALYGVGKHVSSLVDLSELLPRIVEAATQVTQAEEGYIYLVHNDRLLCLAQKRQAGSRAEATQQEVNDRVAARVVEKGQPLVLSRDQLSRQRNAPVSIACVPLLLGSRVIGAMGVRNVSDDAHVFNKH